MPINEGRALATFSPFLAGRYFHNYATKEFGEPSAKLTPTTASFPAAS
jgi:predicted HAD superfamily phosphohydrolase